MKTTNSVEMVKSLNNAYFLPVNNNMRIKITDYFTSKPFEVDTFGMSSTIKVKLKDHLLFK